MCVQSQHWDWEHSVAFELRGPGGVPWRCEVWWQTQCELCILCWEPKLQGSPMMSHGWFLPETPQMHHVFALELIFNHGSFGNLRNAVTFHDLRIESWTPTWVRTHNLQIHLGFSCLFFFLKVKLTRWYLSVAPKLLRVLTFFRNPKTNSSSWFK